MQYNATNDPNAGRLIDSLRYLGYGNYEAIADLVDNSIDADATRIIVKIQQRDGEHQVLIADNGLGMDRDTLDQAMRLGSLTPRDVHSDLGRFGMGLVTASLSIARHCHVVTRGLSGTWASASDVDEIKDRNAFVKHLDKATKAEEAELDSLIGSGSTGTMVKLTKCDNLSNRSNTNLAAATLSKHLARVHRYFVQAGRKIEVNGTTLIAIDPLQLGDERTRVVIDEEFPVEIEANGQRLREVVRARIVLVPDDPATELDVARSMKSQGFYIMRNQREIINAVTLEFFVKHNDFNRMRGEIFFPGTLDRLVGVEFTKRDVELEQSLYDQLASTLKPICSSIKRQEATKNRVTTDGKQQDLHNQAAKVISEKDKLLLKPKAKVEKRAPRGEHGTSVEPKDTGNERKNLTRTQAVEAALGCVIREERMGPNGQIYECDLEGRKIIIRYNIEHPFYQRFVLDYVNDGRAVTAADFLVWSMASAELRIIDEGNLDMINNFKAVLSANLRTLLN